MTENEEETHVSGTDFNPTPDQSSLKVNGALQLHYPQHWDSGGDDLVKAWIRAT